MEEKHLENLRAEQKRWKDEWGRVKRIFRAHRDIYKNKTDVLRAAMDLLEEKFAQEK